MSNEPVDFSVISRLITCISLLALTTLLLAAAIFLLLTSAARSETQRDFPTVNFYDARGNKTGSATTYSGGVTKLYDDRGRLVGTVVKQQHPKER